MADKKKLLDTYIKVSTPEELFTDAYELAKKTEARIIEAEKKFEEFPKSDEIVKEIESKIKPPKDGKTPTDEEIMELIRPLIPKPLKGKDGNLITPEEVREKLKELKGEKRLSIFDLKDTEYLRGKGKDNMQWNSIGFTVQHDNTLTGDGTTTSPLKVLNGLSGITKKVLTSGSGTSWNLPTAPNSVILLAGRGQTLYENSLTNGYSVSGTILTTTDSWSSGDLYIVYI